MRHRYIKERRAFSLIEVMLALAIVSLGIIAILGLLPSGLQSGRDAADNTLSATAVQYTFNALRASPFTAVAVCDACGPGSTPLVKDLSTYSSAVWGGPVSNAYDYAGFPSIWVNAYYKVILNYEPQSPVLTRVTATVVWPAQSKNPVNSSIFITQIAQYDR